MFDASNARLLSNIAERLALRCLLQAISKNSVYYKNSGRTLLMMNVNVNVISIEAMWRHPVLVKLFTYV